MKVQYLERLKYDIRRHNSQFCLNRSLLLYIQEQNRLRIVENTPFPLHTECRCRSHPRKLQVAMMTVVGHRQDKNEVERDPILWMGRAKILELGFVKMKETKTMILKGHSKEQ